MCIDGDPEHNSAHNAAFDSYLGGQISIAQRFDRDSISISGSIGPEQRRDAIYSSPGSRQVACNVQELILSVGTAKHGQSICTAHGSEQDREEAECRTEDQDNYCMFGICLDLTAINLKPDACKFREVLLNSCTTEDMQ